MTTQRRLILAALMATTLMMMPLLAHAAAASAANASPVAGGPEYGIEDLGVFPDGGNATYATGINSSGDVAGYGNHGAPGFTAFRWSNGTLTDLGSLGCGSNGNAINDSGTVVGYSNITCAESDKAGFQAPGATMTDIGTLGARPTIAYAVNASGQIVGSSITTNGTGAAFITAPGGVGMQQIDHLASSEPPGSATLEAHGVNTAGDVVGIGAFNGPACGGHDGPFTFIGGTIQELTGLGGCAGEATGINDSDVVVGYTGVGGGVTHAFLWDGTMHDLGVAPGQYLSFGLGINNSATTVGYSLASQLSLPVAWVDDAHGGMRLLNDLIDPASGWDLEVAAGINDRGQIAGYGAHNGGIHAFRLTPLPARTLTGITVSPANASVALGSTQQFTAAGTYSDGTTSDATTAVTWASSAPTVATIDASGLLTTVGSGSTTISATLGAVSGSSTVTVRQPVVLTGISVTPANPTMALGGTLPFTATGTYSDASTADVSGLVTWSSSTLSVATIDGSGLLTAIGSGSTLVTATSGSVLGSATVTVPPPATLTSIVVTPANPTVAKGDTQQFTATGIYSDGSHADITTTVTWTSSKAKVATIDSSGLLSALAKGATTVKAVAGSLSASTAVTVGPKELVSVLIAPTNPTLSVGGKIQFRATGNYSDGSTKTLTGTWSSSDASVASIGTHNGIAKARTNGSTTITITHGTFVVQAVLTVGEQPSL